MHLEYIFLIKTNTHLFILIFFLESNRRIQNHPGTKRHFVALLAARSGRQYFTAKAQGRIAGHTGTSRGHPKRVVCLEIYARLKYRQAIDGQMPAAVPGKRGTGQNDVKRTSGQAGG